MLIPQIKNLRLQNNFSTEYVAIQMEISESNYNKIENGTIDLKLSKLDKLVKILGVKRSELFNLESGMLNII